MNFFNNQNNKVRDRLRPHVEKVGAVILVSSIELFD